LRFLGIDFGWENKPSGVAALSWDGVSLRLEDIGRPDTPESVVRWVDDGAAEDCGIGIDAPLVIPNDTGMRPCDREAHARFGRYHAGAYPANRSRPFWRRTTSLSEALEQRGFRHGNMLAARAGGRWQIEVHPHAASVQLFGLDQIIKYKRGTLAERRHGLRCYRELLLKNLPRLSPHVAGLTLPELPRSGAALKAAEDQIDAVLCAYIAAHWWYWGRARNHVLGDSESGYIIVPQRRDPRASLADMRESYTLGGLFERDMHPDPVAQFEVWFDQARMAVPRDPNAMALATAAADGSPSVRMVLLKGVRDGRFLFFTSYESRKGRDLAANPRASLLFYWPELERQVRIAGTVTMLPREESAAYFATRPRGSQIGAWASHQSSVLGSRDELEQQAQRAEAEFAGHDVSLPPWWGGYALTAAEFEFWQGRSDRLHDRIHYIRTADRWRIERLSP